MNERELYSGPYADLGKKITLPNSANPIKNAELLKFAEETRKEFYDVIFAVVEALPSDCKVN